MTSTFSISGEAGGLGAGQGARRWGGAGGQDRAGEDRAGHGEEVPIGSPLLRVFPSGRMMAETGTSMTTPPRPPRLPLPPLIPAAEGPTLSSSVGALTTLALSKVQVCFPEPVVHMGGRYLHHTTAAQALRSAAEAEHSPQQRTFPSCQLQALVSGYGMYVEPPCQPHACHPVSTPCRWHTIVLIMYLW